MTFGKHDKYGTQQTRANEMQTTEREHDYEIHELRACVWRGLYAVRDETGNVPVYAGYDRKGAQPIIGDVTEFYETLDSKLREHADFLHALGCFAKAPNRMQTLEGLFLGMRAEDAPVTGAGRGALFVMQLWFAVHAFLQCMRGQQVLLLETHPDRAYALDSDSDSDSDADSDASFVSAKSYQSSPRCVPSSLPPVLEATSSVLLRGDLFDRKRQCVVTGAVLVQVFELLEADTRKVLTKFELPEPLTPAHLEPYMVDSESEGTQTT